MENKYLTDEEELEYFKSQEFRDNIRKSIEEQTWEKGLPMVYLDKNNNIVEHFKDGRINILKTEKEWKTINTQKKK